MSKRALRILLGAIAALACACPNAVAAPVTGPPIGATPNMAIVTGSGLTAGARVSYSAVPGAYDLNAPMSVDGEAQLTGLAPSTTYHYRVETLGAAGSWTPGADASFTTSPSGSPSMITRPVATQAGTSMVCSAGQWSDGGTVTGTSWWQNGLLMPSAGQMLVNPPAGTYACRVTVANRAGSSFMTSAPGAFSPPAVPPAYLLAPSISGDQPARPGSVLTCDSGSWTGAIDVSLLWLRDGLVIPGAHSSTYTVTTADVGHAVVCEAVASGPGGVTKADSAPVNVQASVPAVFPGPSVTPAGQPSPLVTPSTSSGSNSSVVPAPVLVAPIESSSSDDSSSDESAANASAASAALRTLLSGKLPTRKALLRGSGARLSFRAPEALGMLRVRLLGADGKTVLGSGARWFDTARTGIVRLRLTNAGRRALNSSQPFTATLVAIFVPDHGRSSSLSRPLTLRP